MSNIVQDISTLTTLPVSNIEDLTEIIIDCICHDVLEGKLTNSELVTISLGKIGKLLISLTDSELKYKFIPSKYLEENLITTLNSNESSLETRLEQNLDKRIIAAYKDLL